MLMKLKDFVLGSALALNGLFGNMANSQEVALSSSIEIAERVSQLVKSKADSVEKGKVTKYSKVVNTGKDNIWIEYVQSSCPEVEDSLEILRGKEGFIDTGIDGTIKREIIISDTDKGSYSIRINKGDIYTNFFGDVERKLFGDDEENPTKLKTLNEVNSSYLALLGELERLLETLPKKSPKIVEEENHKIDYDNLVEKLKLYNPRINRNAPLFVELEATIENDPKICTRKMTCGESSRKIEDALYKKGINITRISNKSDLINFRMGDNGHTFLRDGYLILDVTYRQFLDGSEGNADQLPALYMGNIEGLAKLFIDNKTIITEYVKNNILIRNNAKVLTDKMVQEFVYELWGKKQ